MKTTLLIVVITATLNTPLAAQWLNQPTPGIPRTPDGKPNLSAPAPRGPDSPVAPEILAKSAGTYEEQRPLWRAIPRVVNITVESGRLYADIDGRGKVPFRLLKRSSRACMDSGS